MGGLKFLEFDPVPGENKFLQAVNSVWSGPAQEVPIFGRGKDEKEEASRSREEKVSDGEKNSSPTDFQGYKHRHLNRQPGRL
jgi:hypothetical protein